MEIYEVVILLIKVLFLALLSVSLVPILVFLERKVCAYIQDRPGPNRTNIYGIRLAGIVQSFADFLKLLVKEEFYSNNIVHTFLYKAVPFLMLLLVLLSCATIPFSSNLVINSKEYVMQAIDSDTGILWYIGFVSISVYSVILSGFASNSKYSLLASMRAGSQSISYEIPMGLAIVSMIITYRSIDLGNMVNYQDSIIAFLPRWGIFMQPLAAIIFIVTSFAETNRVPFDLVEGDSEIVGYHVEYGAMRFGTFFVAEYASMVIASAIIVTMFFGGYTIPYVSTSLMMEHYKDLLFAIGIIIVLFSYLFFRWVNKNNRINYKVKNNFRIKENRFYNVSNFIITLLLVLLVIYLITGNIGANAISITVVVIHVVVFLIKLFMMMFVFIWVRWTVPRFRYDQLHRLCWQKLLPLAVINIIITALVAVY